MQSSMFSSNLIVLTGIRHVRICIKKTDPALIEKAVQDGHLSESKNSNKVNVAPSVKIEENILKHVAHV